MNSINKHVVLKKYIFNYTCFFLILSVVVFSAYIFTGKTFIYDGDGKNQYIPVYIFWSKYLQDFFRTIFIDHTFSIRQWDFSIGEGADILPELSYNIVGDPFSFFSVFIPVKYMYIYYTFMSLFRLYVAGLAFSFMCFKISKHSGTAVLGGALSYVFFQYAIYNVTKHPHFLNILIYFPLMIAGAEQIIKNKSPLLFIVSVFLSAFTSFYFFYMAVLLIIVYVMVRLSGIYSSDFKNIGKYLLMFLLYGLLGTGLAAVVLLPTLATVLHDSRQNMFGHIPLLYSLKYYLYLPSVFSSVTGNIDATRWLIFAFPVPVLLAMYQLFSDSERGTDSKILKKLCIICFIFVLFPVFGLILNGFQYPSNRWCWAFALLCSYILVFEWDSLQNIQKSRKGYILLFIFFLSSLYNFNLIFCSFIQFFIFASFMFIQKKYKTANYVIVQNRIILLAICASVSCTSFFLFSSFGVGFSKHALKKSDFNYLEHNEAEKIKVLNSKYDNGDSFFRYSGRDLTSDIGMVEGMSSVQYYISLTNPKIQEFREAIAFNQAGDLHKYSGYDGRTVLDAISSVKYFYKPEGDLNFVPYGFRPTSDNTIFKNEFLLPLAYIYSGFVFREYWDTLSPIQKQECLLQSVVLESTEYNNSFISQGNSLYTNPDPVFLSREVAHTVTVGDGVTKRGNSLEVLQPESCIYVTFEGLENSETYISLKNLHFTQLSEYDLAKKRNVSLSSAKKVKFLLKKILGLKKVSSTPIFFESSLETSNLLDYKTPDYTWYANRHSFYVNMGYNQKGLSSVKITFMEPGIYTLDKLEVVCLPMNNYEENISNLKEFTLQNEKITTNQISGQISLPSTKLLYFSVPYSIGWKAKIDGKSVPVFQANVMHMGVLVNEGIHDIELEYHTPFLRTGFIISIICCILLFVIFITQKRNYD